MSTQRGNTSRTRCQKHCNTSAFKNNRNDNSHKTKELNDMVIADVCSDCATKIKWKIQYKKYKPLSVPKKCVRCEQKTVKQAYHIVCHGCSESLGVCAKCAKPGDIDRYISVREQQSQQAQIEQMAKKLNERKRRAFRRFISSLDDVANHFDSVVEKFNQLSVTAADDEDEEYHQGHDDEESE